MKKVDRIYRYVLEEDLTTETAGVVDVGDRVLYYGDDKGRWWLRIGPHYKITVRDGYAWDGCSPKLAKIGPLWIGTIDTKRNMRASCVHDALCQFGAIEDFPYTRRQTDVVFYNLMKEDGFRLAGLYHWVVAMVPDYTPYDNTYFLKEV